MGQKIHPKGLRLGIVKDWDSRWYGNRKETPELLGEDLAIRRFIKKRHHAAGIARVEIERGSANKLKVTVHTGKPGMVIGKGGVGVEALRKDLEKLTNKNVNLNILEVKAPDADAQLVAENVASQLERRIAFKRAMKQSITRTMRQAGVQGVKIMVSGRLGGAEIARREWAWEGSIPLHTLRADIDYGFAEAHTTYGIIGVKVWIFKGQVLPAAKKRVLVAQEGGQ
ncbi:30S ribosomal protein S3 [Sulfobacillus thermosulfidooxidans]|uniref:Small ribosomal subunit protein uS3 n=2 Tax=Sulfobacillus thermosulfidooxidans TaxID=28034 RepID=A0A1W1W9F0_SULTA|nr:30S ribosomal protein S3 [Sulfobacillus thermosulfidooxidans]OLZ10947.1 30S ribosomal protein S3 [Sulfobacillus thermosulfidooxidans]OLZ14435.1 30S ribosomal protein S3 [Sulfobacillus thermosulfidooxidans]OLZ19178.1 30S ribosomal protein S3 [Sulfobacillus thermosulfidooxidans]PSR28439.1 MAG: 30S ribosomal protein S3 [Sulfobacillus thermosulfidooxidans]SMC02906.1 small subunit ribosomal protein S3 [Sulfobacillus thermosulfidooxidans DSM 9293]